MLQVTELKSSLSFGFKCLAIGCSILISTNSYAQKNFDFSQPPPKEQLTIELLVDRMRIQVMPEFATVMEATSSGGTRISAELQGLTQRTLPRFPVLVYNVDYQAYGAMSGEFVLKFRDDVDPVNALASLNGVSPVGTLKLYSVRAPSPKGVASFYQTLQLLPGIEWVEPMIEYPTIE